MPAHLQVVINAELPPRATLDACHPGRCWGLSVNGTWDQRCRGCPDDSREVGSGGQRWENAPTYISYFSTALAAAAIAGWPDSWETVPWPSPGSVWLGNDGRPISISAISPVAPRRGVGTGFYSPRSRGLLRRGYGLEHETKRLLDDRPQQRHRQGFRRYWAWKSRRRCGRPMIRTILSGVR